LKLLLQNSIYDINGNISSGKFKSLTKEIKDAIFEHTTLCKSTNLSERIYWIFNDLLDYPVHCKHPKCNKPITRFKGTYLGVFCSYSCNAKYKLLVSPNPFSGPAGIKRRQDGMMKKYGVDHNMKRKESLDKRIETYITNYGVDHPLKSDPIKSQARKANENAGRWTPESEMDLFYLYRLKVAKFTGKQPIKSLPNYENKGKDKHSYSLDHKFSCYEGFKNNIPPYIIGNIVNLEYIPVSENSSKRIGCSITIDELFDRYFTLHNSVRLKHQNL
jgi:hypothetical protein